MFLVLYYDSSCPLLCFWSFIMLFLVLYYACGPLLCFFLSFIMFPVLFYASSCPLLCPAYKEDKMTATAMRQQNFSSFSSVRTSQVVKVPDNLSQFPRHDLAYFEARSSIFLYMSHVSSLGVIPQSGSRSKSRSAKFLSLTLTLKSVNTSAFGGGSAVGGSISRKSQMYTVGGLVGWC